MAGAQNCKRATLTWKMLYGYIGTAAIALISCSEGLKCQSNQFPCNDEKMCIPLEKFCDGSTDCRDGSDEPYWTVNVNYGGNTTVCRRGKNSYTPRLCILPSQLRAKEDELCGGSACRYHEFPCADGSQCVPKSFFCDGIKNCQDGSDELYRESGITHSSDVIICRKENRFCEVTTQFLQDKEGFCESKQCPKNQFACFDGSGCVRNQRFCDGFADCGDKSDEPPLRYNNISYPPRTTFCRGSGDAVFIPQLGWLIRWICVLEPSLEPLADELCSGSTCQRREFSCFDGSQCLPNYMFCDGIVQCNDGSDELYRNNSIVLGDNFTACLGNGRYGDYIANICMVATEAAEILQCKDPTCLKTEYSCLDGSACIGRVHFCNGKADCRDGSDEPPLRNSSRNYPPNITFCRQRSRRYGATPVHSICELPPHLASFQEELCEGSSCTSDEFMCSDGTRCIQNSMFCNGYRDCSDGSDEPPLRNYSVSYGRYDTFCRGKSRSGNGRLICVLPWSLRPQSDQLCDGTSCKDEEFSCFDGTNCIPASSFCDGNPDCIDGSDEPPLRKSNTSYDRDTLFCRGRIGSSICILPHILVFQHEVLCAGSSCSSDEFPCDDGSQCVAGLVYCNGQADCMYTIFYNVYVYYLI